MGLFAQPENRLFIFNHRAHRDHRVEIIPCELCVLCGEHFNVVLAFFGKFWYIFLFIQRGENRWLCETKKHRSLKTKDNLASFRHFFYLPRLWAGKKEEMRTMNRHHRACPGGP
ncbi:MAG: hypothetical protein NUV50_10015 [Rhodospirillales bacterium]|nr:hypothetical protein [Rhodospirillales bacterium]